MTRRPRRGRPPGSTSEATTARILAAARVAFARAGYAATTNKQIADEAGVTTAAIYLYFDSKTALYMATLRDAYAELVRQYRAAMTGASSAREGLRALLAASARLHAQDPTLAAFFSALPVEMKRHEELTLEVAEAGIEIVAIFSEIVDLGVRAGEIPKAAAPDVLALFIACTMGFSLYGATIDSAGLGGIIDAFSALIDGKLFLTTVSPLRSKDAGEPAPRVAKRAAAAPLARRRGR
jgi:AcrR family transcriptional regulator